MGGGGDVSRSSRCAVLIGRVGDHRSAGRGADVGVRDVNLLWGRSNLLDDDSLLIDGLRGGNDDCGSSGAAAIVALSEDGGNDGAEDDEAKDDAKDDGQSARATSSNARIAGSTRSAVVVRASAATGTHRKWEARCVA